MSFRYYDLVVDERNALSDIIRCPILPNSLLLPILVAEVGLLIVVVRIVLPTVPSPPSIPISEKCGLCTNIMYGAPWKDPEKNMISCNEDYNHEPYSDRAFQRRQITGEGKRKANDNHQERPTTILRESFQDCKAHRCGVTVSTSDREMSGAGFKSWLGQVTWFMFSGVFPHSIKPSSSEIRVGLHCTEVEIAIENLKKYKSPGIDQIPAELIQEGGSALYSEIYKLVLAIWEKEIVPEQWKESIIVPIFKKGDKTNCGNFRGISLLLTSYKILSNILLRRLAPYVDEIIGDHQCGFRRNRSTIDQIFCIRQIMEKKWEYKGTVHQLFIDFKKAYDSVKREVLYDILIEFGIPRN
ncbi:hypothetical protein ANN_04729 [Periplaneta americana]|uniref:Reverse transcriptase domain-containing protein n=1 Tax=Periplaneta americana TaxID=6978 RepID=A0ABQ8T9A0_PERAM|nr:hypothetical protein ANN_04729 [Periplaneta americana]